MLQHGTFFSKLLEVRGWDLCLVGILPVEGDIRKAKVVRKHEQHVRTPRAGIAAFGCCRKRRQWETGAKK